jgi:hypothetical protein
MERLLIHLYLDEDVSLLLGKMVRARGFEVITTQDAGNLSKSDADQLAYSAEHGLALLTHNRVDYEKLAREYVASHRSHHGIIVAVRRTPHEICLRLLKILNQVTADEMQDQVRYI